MAGSINGTIYVQLEARQVVRVDGLAEGDDVTLTPVAGRIEHDLVRRPIDVQIATSNEAALLDLGESVLPFDMATAGDDLLLVIDDRLVRVALDGTAEVLGALPDDVSGSLATGVDGPLWLTTTAIFTIDLS